jgi:hypothetical protein
MHFSNFLIKNFIELVTKITPSSLVLKNCNSESTSWSVLYIDVLG